MDFLRGLMTYAVILTRNGRLVGRNLVNLIHQSSNADGRQAVEEFA
jgi:hypothetical protein